MKSDKNAPYSRRSGKGNIVSIQTAVDQQLTECMHDLLWYATEEYADELLKTIGDPGEWEQHGEIGEAISFFIANWTIFCVPVTPRGETIIERYVKWRGSLWRPSTRSILASWIGAAPSFDIVVELQGERRFVVQDVLTLEKRVVRIFDSEPLPQVQIGDLLMGIIVPAGEEYTYFTTFFSFPNMIAHEIACSLKEDWEAYGPEDARAFLRTSFPSAWMTAVRLLVSFIADPFEWEHPNYAAVVYELEKKMPQSMNLNMAKAIWHEYCDTCQPVIRSVPLHAAALHYFVCRILRGEAVTQTDLAHLYGVSASSISKKVNEMMDYMTDHLLSEDFEEDNDFIEEWDDDEYWDEEEPYPVSELVESMLDKLVKTGYIFGKEQNRQELNQLVNEAVREFFEVEENKIYDRKEIRAIAEKVIADLLD